MPSSLGFTIGEHILVITLTIQGLRYHRASMARILSSMKSSLAHIVTLPAISDARGHLGVVDAVQDLGFPIERAFYIYQTPETAHRGGHAHKTLHQFLISLGDPVALRIHDGQREASFILHGYTQGLYLPPKHWVDIDSLSAGTTLLVLCSASYDESDYLRDFHGFLDHSATHPTL